MGIQVVTGAVTTCTFGVSPSTLVITPENGVLATNMPAATIMDNIPMKNIMSFVMCQSLANPTVAAATAAASGVLTPMPCVPVVAAPWAPGVPTILVGNKPTLNEASKAACNWGGVIAITMPGQVGVQVG